MKDNSIYGKSNNSPRYARESNLRGSDPHELRKQWSGLKSPKKPSLNNIQEEVKLDDNIKNEDITENVNHIFETQHSFLDEVKLIETELQQEKPVSKRKIEFMKQLNDNQDEVTKI